MSDLNVNERAGKARLLDLQVRAVDVPKGRIGQIHDWAIEVDNAKTPEPAQGRDEAIPEVVAQANAPDAPRETLVTQGIRTRLHREPKTAAQSKEMPSMSADGKEGPKLDKGTAAEVVLET